MNRIKTQLSLVIAFFLLIFFQTCNSQTSDNPMYIGQNNESFNLDLVTFKENAETLFSQIPHIKIEKKMDDGRTFYIYRVKVADQKDHLFNYYNISEGDVEVFANENNEIVMFSGMKELKKEETQKFMEKLRSNYKKQEIAGKQNQFIDDAFTAVSGNKLIHVTMTCFKDGDLKGNCNVIYNIYKYPQKDNEVIRLMTPNVEVENLLKK